MATLTRGEFATAVSANCAVDRRQAAPDPLGWADLTEFVGETVAAADRRLSSGATPIQASTFSWPKDDGTSRTMTYLDPIDQVVYRALVGRFLRQIETRIDREHVFAAKPANSRPYWRLEPHGAGDARRKALALEWLDEASVNYMATLDVKDFFYTVTPNVLAFSLAPLPGHAPSKQLLMTWVTRAGAQAAVPGLPVGHQASSVLANHLLRATDRALDRETPRWLRYMDDTWICMPTMSMASDLRERYERALGTLHLRVNEAKWHILPIPEAREHVRSSAIEYLESSTDALDDHAELDPRTLFDLALESPREHKRELRRALTRLRTRGDLHAVAALQEMPWLFGIAPEHWSAYLEHFCKQKASRKTIDQDWLGECALRPTGGHPDAERLTYLRVLAKGKPAKDVGRKILDLATDSKVPQVVRVVAGVCWGRSDAWKRNVAIDAAVASTEFSMRRAFTSTLKPRCRDREVQRAAVKLRQLDPDVEPTLEWVRT